MKWHTVLIAFLLAAAGIACYIVMSQLSLQQIDSVGNLDNIGQAARKMMRVATTTTDLAMYYQPYPNPFLVPTLAGLTNSGADLVTMKATYSTALSVVSTNSLITYTGGVTPKQLPKNFGLRSLWETPVLVEHDFVKIPTTEVGMNPYTFTYPNETSTTITVTRSISLFDGVNKMVAYCRDILANADWYNSTLILMPGVNRWFDWPSAQYVHSNADTTFMEAFVNTLDDYAQLVIEAAKYMNNVQAIILAMEGVVLSIGAYAYMWYLCDMVDKKRHSVYSVFMVVPLAMVRSLATQRVNVDDADASDDEGEETALLKQAGKPGHQEGHGDADAGKGGKGGAPGGNKHLNLAGDTAKAVAAPLVSFAARIANAVMFWRKNQPATSSDRRTLSRSLRGVMWMTWPFAMWGAIIILLNELGREKLGTVQGPIMTFNLVNTFQCRSWRVLYAVQLLHFNPPTAASSLDMANRLADLKTEYTAMLFGAKGVPQETSSHYMLATEGVATGGGAGQQILYNMTGCMATPATSCLAATDPFYQYTVHGFDTLVHRMFDVVEVIVKALAAGVQLTNSGPEMQFMWKIRDSMVGGASLLDAAYKSHVLMVYAETLKLQFIALILTLIIAVLYLVFMLRPYLAEVSAETRRVTELLAQLPIDIDVEGLVQRALNPRARLSAAAAAAIAGQSNSGQGGQTSLLTAPAKAAQYSPQRLSIHSLAGAPRPVVDEYKVAKHLDLGGSPNGSMHAPFLRSGSVAIKGGSAFV